MNKLVQFIICASLLSIPRMVLGGQLFHGNGNSFLKSDRLIYNYEEGFAEAIGNVELIIDGQYIKTDRALIDIKNKKVWANREVLIESDKQRLIASAMFLDGNKNKADIRNVDILIKPSDVMTAKKFIRKNEFEGEIYDAAYTPCTYCIKNAPIWQINAKITEIDLKTGTIKYHKATFSVAGYRVFHLPYFSHPMPNAEARSGILKPELERGTLKIPLYYRPHNNMDLTYAPRFNRKLLIQELEFRHLLESGKYQINGSYTHSKIITSSSQNAVIKDAKYHRYNINTKGDFSSNDLKYGFNVGKVSDKSYLKNYYNDCSSYIKSEIYANQFVENGYNHVDVQHYQGLRTSDSWRTDPNALPNYTIRRDYELDSGWNLQLNNNGTNYLEGSNKNISRDSLALKLSKYHYLEHGQIFDFGVYNRSDIYHVKKSFYQDTKLRDKNMVRHIPEVQTNMRWPFYTNLNDTSIVFEPQVSAVAGRNQTSKIQKYSLIDSPSNEIEEHNIFDSSRYAGIDYHEYGKRLSYGLNNYIMGNEWQMSSFLGQLVRSEKTTSNSKSDYVGKIGYSYSDNFEIYYRFQKNNKNFKPHRDEVSVWLSDNGFSIFNRWTALRNLKEYERFSTIIADLNSNVISQNETRLSYNINRNLSIFGELRLDTSKKSYEIVSDSIGTTYTVDCVSFSIKLSNDYTFDPTRNIKKTRSYSVRLGLKTINM